MKSKIKGLEICILNKRSYITGYLVDVKDEVPEQIKQLLAPSVTSQSLRPMQMGLLLQYSGDTKSEDYPNFNHRFIWYGYENKFYYPNLAIDGILALRYNIPVSVIDLDIVEDEISKKEWADYIGKLQQEFYYYFSDTTKDSKNFEEYAYAVSVQYSFLPEYFVKNTSTVIQSEVKEWGQEHLEEAEMRKQQMEEYKEKKEDETHLVPPPFDYDRHADRLVIPRDLCEINFPLVKYMLQAIQNSFGVCFDAEMVRKFYLDRSNKLDVITNFLLKEYGCLVINFNARKCTEGHFGYHLCKCIGIDPYKYRKSNGDMEFKKETLEQLEQEYSTRLEQGEDVSYALNIIQKNLEAYSIKTDLKLIKEIFEGINNKHRCDHLEGGKILNFHCTIAESETKRFTTQRPNIQGKTAAIKSMIRGRSKNRTIVAVDIKAQEPVILVFGVMQNKELQRLTLTYNDCYHAFADLIGVEYTPEMKSIIKVPILSIMNGKSELNIRKEMSQYLDIAEKLLDLIYNDPGYMHIYELAKVESKKARPVRRGLFGTEVEATKTGKYGDSVGTRRRQSINGNFQTTASEIVATCLHAMIFDLIAEENKYNLTLEQVTPVCTIYDEVLFDVDNEVLDEAIELIKFYMLPTVQGWATMAGEITQGEYYVHK